MMLLPRWDCCVSHVRPINDDVRPINNDVRPINDAVAVGLLCKPC